MLDAKILFGSLDRGKLNLNSLLCRAECAKVLRELLLREQKPDVRLCRDQQVHERLSSAVKERTAALEAVGTKLPNVPKPITCQFNPTVPSELELMMLLPAMS